MEETEEKVTESGRRKGGVNREERRDTELVKTHKEE